MTEHYTKKQLEELYYCSIDKDFGFDDSHLFWVAQGSPVDTKDENTKLFTYADGWTLDELHENIREQILNEHIKWD